MHVGQDRTDFRRGRRADDANCVTGFKLQLYSTSLVAKRDVLSAQLATLQAKRDVLI